jgi:hypothetical protein
MTSLLDDLEALDQRLRRHEHKELAVPGTGGRIAVRYSVPEDRARLRPVMVAYGTGEPLSPDEELQLLIDCRGEVRHGDPETGETVEYDGGPLYFDASDERWGAVATARECVNKVFRLDRQPLAIGRHVSSIVAWLQGLDAELEARVLGNSLASPSSDGEASADETTSPEPVAS